MKHTTWTTEITGGASLREIARETGISYSTINVQLSRGTLSAENVIKIAIAYNTHPVRALVDTGYLDEKYARAVDPASAIRTVTEDELADEVLRRMKIGVKTDALTTPVDELLERRSKQATPDVDHDPYADGTVPEWDDSWAHAADSSPSEQEEREKRGEDLID